MSFFMAGGDKVEARRPSLSPFVECALKTGSGPLALVIAEPDDDQAQDSFRAYVEIFESLLPLTRIQPLYCSLEVRLTQDRLAAHDPCGLFVSGGATPFYQQTLCQDNAWTDYLYEQVIPYGGTSAGAAIAADKAILGD